MQMRFFLTEFISKISGNLRFFGLGGIIRATLNEMPQKQAQGNLDIDALNLHLGPQDQHFHQPLWKPWSYSR